MTVKNCIELAAERHGLRDVRVPQKRTFGCGAISVTVGQNRTFEKLLPTQLVLRVCVGRSEGGGKPLGVRTKSRPHPKSFWSAAKRFT